MSFSKSASRVLLAFGLLLSFSARSASPVAETPAYGVRISWLVRLSAEDWSRWSGRRLNPVQRVSLSVLRHNMKTTLRKKGDMTLGEYLAGRKKMATWLKIVLIILGAFLLAFIIFAMAYGGVI